MTDTRGLFWSLLAPNLLAICPCQRFHPEECPPCLVPFPRGCDFHGMLPEAGSAATWAGRMTGARSEPGRDHLPPPRRLLLWFLIPGVLTTRSLGSCWELALGTGVGVQDVRLCFSQPP